MNRSWLRCGLLAVVVAAILVLSEQVDATTVAPIISPYKYQSVRCETWLTGFTSYDDALTAEATRAYGTPPLCWWVVDDPSRWGTAEDPMPGACGSDNYYPTFQWGIETANSRNPQIYFTWYMTDPVPCTNHSIDGMTVERRRSVACPANYTWNGLGCQLNSPIDPDKNNNTCPAGPNGSNPINTALGYKVEVERDFALPGAFPIVFERYYTSATFWEAARLGPHWRHTYDRRISYVVTDNVTTAYVLRQNGDRFHFNESVPGSFMADSDVQYSLTKQVDGGGAVTGWTLTTPDDEVESYDSDGKLLNITNRDGRQQTLTYTGELLTSVQDDSGRAITLNYFDGDPANNGHIDNLSSVELPDGSTYTYVYAHGADSTYYLQRVYPPATAGSPYREYEYGEGANGHAWLLTGIVDENGARYATWQYDTLGRAWLSVHGDVNSTVDRVEFTYNGNINSNQSATVTAKQWIDAVGSVTKSRTYGFAVPNGVAKMASVSAPCQACGGGAIQSETYDANGYPDLATDFNGTVTDHDYNARGLETQRVDAKTMSGGGTPSEKRTIQTDWDPTFRIPTERRTYNVSSTLEVKTVWVYNTRGQVTARCEIDPADTSGYACSASTPPGATAKARRWAYTYCEQADVMNGTCPLVGLLKSMDGPRLSSDPGMKSVEDTTTRTYYQSDDPSCRLGGTCSHRHGDLWKLTNALGQITEYVTYDKNGRVTRVKDSNGTYMDFQYHPRGWLTKRTARARADGIADTFNDASTSISYDGVGNVVSVIHYPETDLQTYTYDDAHRLVKVTSGPDTIDYCPGGVGSANCLDSLGNRRVEQVKDSSGTIKRSLSRVYNELSQLTQIVNANSQPVEQSDQIDTALDGHVVTDGYDPNGNRVLVDDGLGTRTRQTFDPLNRLKAMIRDYQGSDPATSNTETEYVYDTRDNLRAVTDPDGLATNYTYDGLDNLTDLSSPDTGHTGYSYDKAGNRTTQTDNRGTTSSYTYDSLNRLVAIGYPTTNVNISYAYDQSNTVTGCTTSYPIGQITKMTDESGSTTYCYDRHGNVITKKQVTNGLTFTTTYAYSPNGRLTNISYPSGMQVSYTRDWIGRVTAIYCQIGTTLTTVVSNATYYPSGPLNVLTFGNGRTQTKTYDTNYAIDQITSSASGGLTLDFGVDVMDDVKSVSSTIGPPAPDRTYVYDALYRLETVQSGATHLEDYTYTRTGDRLSAALNGGAATTYAYTAGTHQLSGVGSTARTYDQNGNTRTGVATGFTFDYNDKNRFASAQKGLTSYAYQTDGRGERVQKYQSGANGTTTEYTYDEGGRLLGQYGNSGTALAEYIYLESNPVAIVKNGALAYIETDQLATARQVIDPATNNLLWKWDLLGNAFGANAPVGATYSLNLRFPGQYFDTETGLNYNYRRDYEPSTGRYIESDPIGLGGGLATYAYAGTNPTLNVDPMGLVKWFGSYYAWSFGRDPVTGVIYTFTLTSECVHGKKAMVKVSAKGAGFGVGWPAGNTGGMVTLDDHLDYLYPHVFDGVFQMTGAGGAFGLGYGCQQIILGGASTPFSCDWGAGVDLSASAVWGRSETVWVAGPFDCGDCCAK